MAEIREILALALAQSPSDLHISVGVPPVCRVDGRLRPLPLPACTPADTERFLRDLLNEEQQAALAENGELDVSLTLEQADTLTRMRLNAFRQRGSYCMAIRILNLRIPSFEELGLPVATIESFCALQHGLVLVTGPTGTGKTTTITAMIDWINRNRSCHIITLEDPIEYLHRHGTSIISQREIETDTISYVKALRAALRQAPDVILLGEMRDSETMGVAMTAAETGHLIFSTLHTVGAANAIDRIIDSFSPAQQNQIRVQVAQVLVAVVSQQLVPTVDGGEVPAFEIMLVNTAIRNMIRE
ncbi:MAG: PilT/PilU family type 4a pilus ATPase, partial [Oscillospiraceae bacterium]